MVVDARMCGKLGRHRIGRAYREHIDHASTLQIHEDRSIVMLPLLPAPVVNAHDKKRLRHEWRGDRL